MSDALCVAQSPPARSPKKQGPRSGVNRLSRLTQAFDLQDILVSVAKLLKADLEATTDASKRARLAIAIASNGRSWQGLQTEVMVLKGHGKPRPVEARNATPKQPRKPRTIRVVGAKAEGEPKAEGSMLKAEAPLSSPVDNGSPALAQPQTPDPSTQTQPEPAK